MHPPFLFLKKVTWTFLVVVGCAALLAVLSTAMETLCVEWIVPWLLQVGGVGIDMDIVWRAENVPQPPSRQGKVILIELTHRTVFLHTPPFFYFSAAAAVCADTGASLNGHERRHGGSDAHGAWQLVSHRRDRHGA